MAGKSVSPGKPGAKPPSPAKSATGHSSDDFHEDKTVREILALAKSECACTALTPLFEYNSRKKPHASVLQTIHLRLSALEVLKPCLKELTISLGEGRGSIKEISSRKGLGKFLRSYSTDTVASPLQTLIFHKIHIKFGNLQTDLPKSVKKVVFRQCVINDVGYHVPWVGDSHRSMRLLAGAERLENETFSLEMTSTDKSNFCALARALYKTMSKKYDQAVGDWDDYTQWLARHVEEKSKAVHRKIYDLAKFWSLMLKKVEINSPIPTTEKGWLALFKQLDRVAVKDIANFVGGTFKRPRAKSAKSPDPKKTPPAGATQPPAATPPAVPPAKAPPAAGIKKK